MAAVRCLGFVVRVFGARTKSIILVVFIVVQNLVEFGAVVSMISTILYFARLS